MLENSSLELTSIFSGWKILIVRKQRFWLEAVSILTWLGWWVGGREGWWLTVVIVILKLTQLARLGWHWQWIIWNIYRKEIIIFELFANTGSFTRTALFNMLIIPFRMSLYKVKLDAKFHWGYNILIYISLNLKKSLKMKKIIFCQCHYYWS